MLQEQEYGYGKSKEFMMLCTTFKYTEDQN